MNILFTGANGFLGKNVIPHISKDNKIYSLDLSKADFTCNISNQIPDFKEFEFDIVFHAAGKAHSIPKNLTEEKIFFDINETGTKNFVFLLSMANCFPAIACADYRYSIGYYFTFSTLPEQKIFVLSGTMVG